tara:strand:+ start:21208 stop:22212 length:1005 start_codon:yes stop_codon:yes gene_type:complete
VRYKVLTLFVMILVLGCDSSHRLQLHLQEYQDRMAKVVGVESPDKLNISLPPYPTLRELNQNIPATTIKLFEFYTLKHCELYSLVAQRNTSLGNLQLPSIRYFYERQLIEALDQCLISSKDAKLQAKLVDWKQTKVEQLPLVWADLIQLSSEMKQGLSANYGLVQGNEQDGLIQTKDALNFLLYIDQNKQLSSARLEQHLKNLKDNPLPAKLWLSQLTLSEYLTRATLWLTLHSEDLQCDSTRSKQKVDYLTNVFYQFFIEKIQPIASQMNHYQYQLGPIFEIMSAHPHLSPSFKNYIKQFNQQGFENYQIAMQQHVLFWQSLFKRCNKQPGKP